MKKPVLIVIIMVAVLVIGGGAYWLGTRSSTNTNTTNQTAANANTAVNANISAPKVTYAANTDKTLYGFDMVKEWTNVAPEEVQKSITAEQRNGYEVVYFSTNSDSAVLSVSEKKADGKLSAAAIVAGDRSQLATNPNAKMTNERVNQSDAQTEIHVTSGTNQFTVFSRYLITFSTDTETRWTLMEVTVPTSRTDQYREIVAHLLDSLQLAGSSANTNASQADTEGAFAATGEKVNDLLYRENFSTIELGTHRKNDPPQTASYGISRINYSGEDLAYHLVTTDGFPAEGSLTLKVYDYAAGNMFAGEQKLDIKRGSNGLCCFSPPGQGRYQYLFYYGTDLVKVLDLTSE